MRVVVNTDICEANEVCVSWCSEVFRLGEDDRATILLNPIPENLRPAVERAVRSCPRQALSLRERDIPRVAASASRHPAGSRAEASALQLHQRDQVHAGQTRPQVTP
jgi:ferredoxin